MKIEETLSYDDVLLEPSYSEVLPGDARIHTRLTRTIHLNIPLISAAMDTVTEAGMAIALALEGGSGVIHRNMDPVVQAAQVAHVKRFLNWIIESPITVEENESVANVRTLMLKNNVSGFPVVDDSGRLRGIITGRDLRFCSDDSLLVREIMTENPIVETGLPTPESAREKFDRHKIEKLPVVDEAGLLTGLITVKDMEKHQKFPRAAVDDRGRLRVGAAVSPIDFEKRLPLLLESKADYLVIDTAHGDSKSVIEAVREIKRRFTIQVIGGNVATRDGATRLIEAGADAIKVGVGPGSICTTRVVAGIGVPQFSAVAAVVEVAEKHDIPVIADGGIKFSGDIVKAIAAGAETVMIGNLFAGLKEAPGREIIYDGRMFKTYRGMGSVGAIKEGGGDRYQMKNEEDPVPEGIEGRVPYKGELKPYVHQLVTGLQKGMSYCGCATLEELRRYKKFVKISPAGLRESHAHDVVITHDAPNYSRQ